MCKLTVLVLLLVVVSAVLAKSVPESRVLQGTNAVTGQFPFMVALNIQNNPTQAFCGGVIVNQNHVLTAASCLLLNGTRSLMAANQMTVLFGTVQSVWTSPVAQVQALYIHPQYNPYNFDNDIGVVRVFANFQFPPPSATANLAMAVMNERIVGDNVGCQVVGWNTNIAQPLQQFLNVPIQNRDTCNNLVANLNQVRESTICAGLLTAGPGVCVSNRGGGLFCNGLLTGILSSGLGCGAANAPGLYTQVRYHRQWIEQQFTRQDIPPAGPTPPPRF